MAVDAAALHDAGRDRHAAVGEVDASTPPPLLPESFFGTVASSSPVGPAASFEPGAFASWPDVDASVPLPGPWVAPDESSLELLHAKVPERNAIEVIKSNEGRGAISANRTRLEAMRGLILVVASLVALFFACTSDDINIVQGPINPCCTSDDPYCGIQQDDAGLCLSCCHGLECDFPPETDGACPGPTFPDAAAQCTTSQDCGEGFVCAYALAYACDAVGTCVSADAGACDTERPLLRVRRHAGVVRRRGLRDEAGGEPVPVCRRCRAGADERRVARVILPRQVHPFERAHRVAVGEALRALEYEPLVADLPQHVLHREADEPARRDVVVRPVADLERQFALARRAHEQLPSSQYVRHTRCAFASRSEGVVMRRKSDRYTPVTLSFAIASASAL